VADTQIGRIRQLEHETRLLATIAGLRSGSGLGDGGPALNAFLSLPAARPPVATRQCRSRVARRMKPLNER
jgi:hypothetical protein